MRSLFPIACNQAGAILLGILGAKLISTFVPPAVNGRYALFVTLTQIGLLVTHSGLINHATRYWQREQQRPTIYLRFLWSASWHGLKFLAPVLLLIALVLVAWEKDVIWLWLLPGLVVSNLALSLNSIASGVLNAGQQHWKLFGLSLTEKATRVLLPIILALGAGVTLGNLSIGYTLHGLLLVGCWFLLFSEAIRTPRAARTAETDWVHELRDYGRPFMWLGVGAWVTWNIDRWIVEHFYGEAQLGYFAFAIALGAIAPMLIMGALMQWFFPKVFHRADTARTVDDWRRVAKRCDQFTLLFLMLTVAGVGALHLCAPLLVGSLIDANYLPSLPMVFSAGLTTANASVNQFYYLLLQGQHNSAAIVKVALVLAAFKIVGSVLAAMISWEVFLGWLVVCLVGSWLAGRSMILHMALKRAAQAH